MFRVEHHYLGAGLWNRGAPPMTEQGATFYAQALRDTGLADDARVVLSQPLDADPGPGVDLRV